MKHLSALLIATLLCSSASGQAASYNELLGIGSHSEDTDLAGWWPLLTNLNDASSNGINGTLSGSTFGGLSTTGPNSYLTNGLHLNKVYYIDLGANAPPSTTGFTWAGWIYIDVGHTGLISSAYDAGAWQQMYVTASGLTGRIHQTKDTIRIGRTAPAVTAAAWRHVAMTWDGGTTNAAVKLYVSGSAVDTGNDGAGSFTGIYNSAVTQRIGNQASGAALFDGIMSEQVQFGRGLTAAEIVHLQLGPELINSVAPVVSGTETEGSTLSCTTGTWGLDAPFSSGSNGTATYAYQWTRSNDGSGTGEADIGGATSSTYTLVSADASKYIRCRVRASNTGGYDSAADTNSNFTGAIAGGSSANSYYYQQNQ